AEVERLESTAKRLGVRSEELARTVLTDLLGHPQEGIVQIAPVLEVEFTRQNPYFMGKICERR
ncbi:MAG: hypothetical protein DRH50_16115, partial [Deltaproteobacteria bacterium]